MNSSRVAKAIAVQRLPLRSIAFDIAVAAIFAVLGTNTATYGPHADLIALVIAVGVATRRVFPPLTAALTITTVLLQVATGWITLGGSLGYGLIVYTWSCSDVRWVHRASLTAVVVGTVPAGWRLTLGGDGLRVAQSTGMIFSSGVVFAFLGGCWAAGYATRQRRRAQTSAIAEVIAKLQQSRAVDRRNHDEQRMTIARDMHDVLAHSLAVVVAQAEGARYAARSDTSAVEPALNVIASTARTALGDVRTLLQQLRSDAADPQAFAGDPAAQQDDLLHRMRGAGMTIDISTVGLHDAASPMLVATAHRLLTEALTNALKYGDLSKPVVVRSDWTQGLHLAVSNTIAADHSTIAGGHGIAGMTERATLAGGTLSSYADGTGHWCMTAVLPPTADASKNSKGTP